MSFLSHSISKILLVVFALATIAAIPLTVTSLQHHQETKQHASEGGTTQLTFSPQTATASVGQPLSVNVVLKAGANDITGADITMQFNAATLPITQFTPATGTFNSILIKSIDPATNTFHFVGTNTDPNTHLTGDITLGTLTLNPVANGQGDVTIQATQIIAAGSTTTVAVTPQNGLYTIARPTPTTAPTNTPVPPTDTPVPPTATPIPPTPTNTPVPTATPTPIPTNTPIPTATPTTIPTNTPIPPTPTNTPVPPTSTSIPATPIPTRVAIAGDANGDGVVDILDYNIWRDEFLGTLTTKTSDFNHDGKIDLLDFNIWRTALGLSSLIPVPSNVPTNTPVPPTPTRIQSPTPTTMPNFGMTVNTQSITTTISTTLSNTQKIVYGNQIILTNNGTYGPLDWDMETTPNTSSPANGIEGGNSQYGTLQQGQSISKRLFFNATNFGLSSTFIGDITVYVKKAGTAQWLTSWHIPYTINFSIH